jgi:hypothetical protein
MLSDLLWLITGITGINRRSAVPCGNEGRFYPLTALCVDRRKLRTHVARRLTDTGSLIERLLLDPFQTLRDNRR